MSPKQGILWLIPLCVISAFGWAATPAPPDYVLDDTGSGFALYPGQRVRSSVKEKDEVHSYKELKSRVLALPRGTRLYWVVSTDDSEGNPMLFQKGQFADFQQICNQRGIRLNISHTGPARKLAPPPPEPPPAPQVLKLKSETTRGQALPASEKPPSTTLEESHKTFNSTPTPAEVR